VSSKLPHSILTRVLAWTAAVAFATSWFLPVLEGIPGWMAFRHALAPLVPYSGASGANTGIDAVPQVLSALTNIVFIILFVLWACRQAVRPGLFVRIAIACFILNLYWFETARRDHHLDELLIGYYLWLGAFALLLATASVIAYADRRTSKTPTGGTPS
jgi:hypothetical protein